MAYARNRVPSMQRESGVRKLIERTTRHRLDSRGPGCICGDVTRAGRRDLASAARHCACVRTEQDAIAGRSRRGTRRFACERTPPMQDLEIVVSKTKRPGATRIQGLDERRCGDHSPVESLAARSM